MVRIKYGNSVKNGAENISLRFGTKKFGEPLIFSGLNTLLKYLPQFIIKNNICLAIMTSIAIQMLKWQMSVAELVGFKTKGGFSSWKYAYDDLQLFISDKQSDQTIVNSIRNYYKIHKKRGSFNGIVDDIQRLSNNGLSYIRYKDFSECGWFLDKTYPMYADEHTPSEMTTVFLELDNMMDIGVRNNGSINEKTFLKILREEFVPVIINIRVNLYKPHVVKFKEVINGNNLKFGNFKMGEIINE